MCQLKNGVAYRLVSSIPFEVSVSLRNRHQYPTYECRFFFLKHVQILLVLFFNKPTVVRVICAGFS